MKPLIGITMNLEVQPAKNLNILDQAYGKAVFQAGGVPVPVLGIEKSIPELVKRLDGFVFTGGDDIDPRFYKEKPLSGARISSSPDKRVRFELELFKAATKAKKPVLAICYGAQLVNVALGGRLYQDIALQVPDAMKHGASKPGEKVFHEISILEGTLLSRAIDAPRIRVRSAHHQSVKNPGRGLHLSAISRDGVIEALESRTKHFLLAIQWHPEKIPDDRQTKKLFKAFVLATQA